MVSSKVLTLSHFRGRRERRRVSAVTLHSLDPDRLRVLHHLGEAVERSGGDRAAVVWLDEYDVELPHPFAVLDLGADTPRRDVSVELIHRVWRDGGPTALDVPGREAVGVLAPDAARAAFAVSLGSDGLRAWFFVLEWPRPRDPLPPDVVDDLLFLAGECAGVVLHRDLTDPDGEVDGARFAGWPVLRDAPGDDEDAVDAGERRRVACRFVVVRTVRALLEEDLAVAGEQRAERVEGVAGELLRDGAPPESDPECRAWWAVVRAIREGDDAGLPAAVLSAGERSEERTHWHGAAELYRVARECAAAVADETAWLDATRMLGRVCRKMGRWDEAAAWYERSREAAARLEAPDRQARAMDGLATVHILRGRIPAARRVVEEALPVATASGDPDVRASVLHSCMTVAHTEGRLEDAARHGWAAVETYERDEAGRLRSLTGLGGVFLEARALDAAEDAFSVVAARVDDRDVLLHALSGLSLVEAYRGREDAFRARLDELERAGFAQGTPAFRAESLLESGDGFLALGDEAEARRWYGRALEVAERHDLAEYVIRADEAVARLDRLAAAPKRGSIPTAPPSPLLDEEELAEIQTGLGRLRQEAGASG